MLRVFVAALAIAGVTIIACGSDSDGPAAPSSDAGPTSNDGSQADARGTTNSDASFSAGSFSFTAKANEAPPATAKLVVIWSVSSGSPDYSYAFGSGSSQGTEVMVSFSSDPPAEALNKGKLGVGVLAFVDPAYAMPEGKLTERFDSTKVLAFAPNYAIVYRNTTETVMSREWEASFPQGFACGRCERKDQGFDSFSIIDCSNVEFILYTKNEGYCNWT